MFSLRSVFRFSVRKCKPKIPNLRHGRFGLMKKVVVEGGFNIDGQLSIHTERNTFDTRLSNKDSDINKNSDPQIYKQFDDGYIVRAMRPEEAKIVQGWYSGMGKISNHDLDVCLSVFPPGPGFYIGEYKGEVVASAIRIPWSENVYYGSYYYVAKEHRRGGYGCRLRDEVAFSHVGSNILCVDAVMGKVADTNREKFSYVDGFKTFRYAGPAKSIPDLTWKGKIVKAQDISFEDLIHYDSKCFITSGNPVRRAFMEKWINIPGGAAHVALDDKGHIAGFATRRPGIPEQEKSHAVGPIYAESGPIAEALLQACCNDVLGHDITINIWEPNKEAVSMVQKFGFSVVFEVQRQHVNGNPKEFKPQVFALTSIDVCGF